MASASVGLSYDRCRARLRLNLVPVLGGDELRQMLRVGGRYNDCAGGSEQQSLRGNEDIDVERTGLGRGAALLS